ncbi:hypothetical protein H2201_007031 [Coniosporium apollinis]|uniref:Ubiquitin-like-conjugating enzyme ATG10 n=1 Tax=Coniosporium apollinis TaxID=61459 RepID=A0ABQ9NMI7_9PEZI|nr:hypothetical protein H2201_007031 [Coniosporium apollinis]
MPHNENVVRSERMAPDVEPVAVTGFPFISSAEFRLAAVSLVEAFKHNCHRQHDWESVQLIESDEGAILRIIRAVEPSSSTIEPSSDDSNKIPSDDDEVEEHDDEVRTHAAALLSRTPSAGTIVVQYDIILSQTYFVPVLHISIFTKTPSSNRPITSLDTLYDLLVPQAYSAQLQRVGVVGGISMCNHPITSHPVFFVHPCNTTEALQAAIPSTQSKAQPEPQPRPQPTMQSEEGLNERADARPEAQQEQPQVTQGQYMRLWISTVGGCVGLHVPVALAAADAVTE